MISKYPLIGVGAPTGIFLGDTAELMETGHKVPEYSMVANAVGAACGDIVTEYTLWIRENQDGNFMVTGGDGMEALGSYKRALERAEEIARAKAEAKARMQTDEGSLKVNIDKEEDFFRMPAGDSVLVETKVTASVQIII